MKLLTFLFLSIFLNSSWSYQVIRELRKQINDGEILGRYITSETGRTISAFIGIPFAAPPVGDLRFRGPQKVTPWNGTLLTQDQRAKCPQIDTITGSTVVEGNEDCLYVNVYVPARTTSSKLDVLVWVHGGGFTAGHGGPSTYGPAYLLEHDVILVAGNYRLGPLGFLSTEDTSSPGNYGLKDVAFLLQWVQANIEHFNGDKNSVTIWGESAGAVSVAYQMISPLASGLFHRAISNSGGLSGPARTGVARQRTIRLAELMNCPVLDDNAQIIQCLRNVSPEDMIYAGVSFPIVVESFPSDEPPFIVSRNYNNRFANFAEIPWLVGMNSEEILLYLGSTLDDAEAFDTLITNWDISLPTRLGYSTLNATARDEITRSINQLYFGTTAAPNNQVDKQLILNIFTDTFLSFIESVQRRLEESSHSSTYLYLFTHRGKASFSTASNYYGTSHADDLIALFPLRKTNFYSSLPSMQDRELTNVMSRMWTNFARFGNPTPDASSTQIWPSVSNSNFATMEYMQIGNENGNFNNTVLQAKQNYYSARAELWKQIRQDYDLNSWFE